jgi:hypothetical protein
MLFFLKLNNRIFCKMLAVTSVLFLALASAAPVLQAQDWDQINGRDKVHDPTGAWLMTPGDQFFVLITFQRGGTALLDFQGEGAFDPAAVNPPMPPRNVQTLPEHGVWQKTGWKSFVGTFLALEAGNDTRILASTFFRFDKLQFTGRLSESGDQMDLTIVFTFFNADGKPNGEPSATVQFKGVRVPLESSADMLPVPVISPTPAAP